MAISDKLNYLLETKQAIKQALIDKGQEVADTDTFRSYADKIASIQTENFKEYKVQLVDTGEDTNELSIFDDNAENIDQQYMIGTISGDGNRLYIVEV